MEIKPFHRKITDLQIQQFLHFNSVHDLSHLINIDTDIIEHVLDEPKRYHEFPIPKRKGGKRLIHSPSRPLKDIQKRLSIYLTRIYHEYAPAYVHGFIRSNKKTSSRNILTNATQHLDRPYVLNIDIENFFPSINAELIKSAFNKLPFQMYSDEGASIISLLLTRNWILPAGSPASPIVSNIIFYETDIALHKYCIKNKLVYTRYADDLTFSGELINDHMTEAIKKIIIYHGFMINDKKVRLQSKQSAQYVTGIKVNNKLNVNRKYIRQLRSILHDWESNGIDIASTRYYAGKLHRYQNRLDMYTSFKASVHGKLAFLQQIKQEEPVLQGLYKRFIALKNTYM
ncbi:reverse transcriptase family protein [Lacibacter sediminis]|uniref:RNA-directed DNA polymerase n=1 Tax=Lacibacter sediminis TaxID=2760713 RepID=A0A7G5XFR0_9BACT|nr:reverse transcriptase family protein [Lacibacter sediminis]QNA44313.1 RNA-directed DNA polymerase [Lacibacter sediminis]